MALLVRIVAVQLPAPRLAAPRLGQPQTLPPLQLEQCLRPPTHRLVLWLLLALRWLLRELILALVVLALLALPTPVAPPEVQQGTRSAFQLRLVPLLTRPVVAPVVEQLGSSWALYLLVRLLLLARWPVLLRWDTVPSFYQQLPDRWRPLHRPVARLATLVALPARLHTPFRRPTLLVLVVPRLRPLLLSTTAQLRPVVTLLLPTRLVTLLYDLRLRLTSSGALSERPPLLERPPLPSRQWHVPGRLLRCP